MMGFWYIRSRFSAAEKNVTDFPQLVWMVTKWLNLPIYRIGKGQGQGPSHMWGNSQFAKTIWPW